MTTETELRNHERPPLSNEPGNVPYTAPTPLARTKNTHPHPLRHQLARDPSGRDLPPPLQPPPHPGPRDRLVLHPFQSPCVFPNNAAPHPFCFQNLCVSVHVQQCSCFNPLWDTIFLSSTQSIPRHILLHQVQPNIRRPEPLPDQKRYPGPCAPLHGGRTLPKTEHRPPNLEPRPVPSLRPPEPKLRNLPLHGLVQPAIPCSRRPLPRPPYPLQHHLREHPPLHSNRPNPPRPPAAQYPRHKQQRCRGFSPVSLRLPVPLPHAPNNPSE